MLKPNTNQCSWNKLLTYKKELYCVSVTKHISLGYLFNKQMSLIHFVTVTFIMAERLLFSHLMKGWLVKNHINGVWSATLQFSILSLRFLVIAPEYEQIFTLWRRLKRAKLSCWWLSSKGNLHSFEKWKEYTRCKVKKGGLLRKLTCQL